MSDHGTCIRSGLIVILLYGVASLKLIVLLLELGNDIKEDLVVYVVGSSLSVSRRRMNCLTKVLRVQYF